MHPVQLEQVMTRFSSEPNPIITLTSIERVVSMIASAGKQQIIAGATLFNIGAFFSHQCVMSRTTDERVPAVSAIEDIVATASVNPVFTRACTDNVIAFTTPYCVVSI